MGGFWLAVRPLGLMIVAIVLILTFSRAALVALWWPRVEGAHALGFIASQGLRFDLVLVGMVLIPPLLLMPLLASTSILLPLWKNLLSIYVPLVIMCVLFMELSTVSFAEQFDARPNILFFEYFEYPKEILSTLWGAYRAQVLIGVPVVFAVGFGVWHYVHRLLETAQPVSLLVVVPASIALALISGLCARSTLDHRPVNPSTVARTTDALINELALNSTYTVAYAAYEMRHEDDGGSRYAEMDSQTALDIVRREMLVADAGFSTEQGGTWRSFKATQKPAKPKNLVIILQESLGAEFVGSLGGLDLTPNIDALREEGFAFDQLYATGTRSVRGIEAVITGFLPTPSRSVVKLTKSQRDFFTIASFLKEAGYDTSFIYGGEAHFDNMRRFFMNNGFDQVVDEKDYENPVFTGSWGVSDEDLMNRAHEEFSKPRDKPFFSLVFSSSNHTPFEFPDDRIELFEAEKQTVNNAVKYADYAIGEFFNKARPSNYWNDTVFLVVADHNSRVYGSDLVPVKRFHIPGVIIGADIEPFHEKRVASQVDLAPTLLSLIGVSGTHPMPGRDYTALPKEVPGRAIMQFNSLQAYMESDELVVLQRGVAPIGFRYNGTSIDQLPEPSPDLIEKAVGHATWAADAYQNGGYKIRPVARSAAGKLAVSAARSTAVNN
jgi:phosphoglycerol transferase MdoB-like AlkP superfamily enzyme